MYSIDPITAAAARRVERGGHCACLLQRTKKGTPLTHALHKEPQDLTAPGWDKIKRVITSDIEAHVTIFEPSARVPPSEMVDVITLPIEIRNLTDVREIRLYGSHLRRLPPEIGDLPALENLDVYTSYSLHWLPYEITRCKNLHQSRMSTRALYGNRNTRLPFPRLHGPVACLAPSTCSVCAQPFLERSPRLYWTTLPVGTDVTPLLIHSCSERCTELVPDAPAGYDRRPHKGGAGTPPKRVARPKDV